MSALQASPFCDKHIFSKIAARLGGNVKAVVSGGAPLASHVEEFLRVTMCAPVRGHLVRQSEMLVVVVVVVMRRHSPRQAHQRSSMGPASKGMHQVGASSWQRATPFETWESNLLCKGFVPLL